MNSIPAHPRSHPLAPLGVIGAAMLFGTTGTALELGPDEATPLGAGAVRLAVGALVLVLVARLSAGPARGWHGPTVLAGAIGVAGYGVCFFTGTHRAGVAIGTVLAIGSGPVFAGLIELLLHRRHPGPVWLKATALAVAGGSLLALGGGTSGSSADLLGMLAALAAGLSYAVYAGAAKALQGRGMQPTWSMASIFIGGAVLVSPLLVTEPNGWVTTGDGLLMVAHLALLTLVVAYVLYGWALQHLSVPVVVTLTLAEPLTATLLAVVVLDERPSVVGWLGAVLVVAGLGMVGWSTRPAAARRAAASLPSGR